MAEILDQGDIDALLRSVGSPTDPTTEIQAGPPAVAAGPDAFTYDFERPERVSKDHIRALASIHDGFARSFAATLSGYLRTLIDMRVVDVEQLTYNEFISTLPNPTCFMTLRAPPLEGQMCLEMSPLIVFPIIDRLLGGNNAELFIPQRPLSSIELRLVARLIERALEQLSEAWRNLVEVRFELASTESNPQLVHIVAPTEVVVFITFEIKVSHFAGTMCMCVPYNTIESVLSRLTSQTWFNVKPKAASEVQHRRLLRSLHRSSVPLCAYLGGMRIRMSELRGLKPGDVLPLNKPADGEVVLRVAGQNKFAGSVGQLRGNRAIRLRRPAVGDEPL